MSQLLYLVECCKFSKVASWKFAIAFFSHVTSLNLKIQEYSIVTHQSDSSNKTKGKILI